jgi:hypothetical protein
VGQKVNSFEEFKGKTCWIGTVFNMEEEKYGIPLFDGNNYPDWKFRITKSGQGVKLITHLQLVPRSRKLGSIHPPPPRKHLHSVVPT